MEIRQLSYQQIDTVIEFLQNMLDTMTALGGHALKSPDTVATYFQSEIAPQIDLPDHLFLGAELDSTHQLIGMLEASIKDLNPIFLPQKYLHIHAIYVVPEHRRCGIGRSLMESAFVWGRSKGCVEADLNVLQNSPAKFLYQDLGFEPFQIQMRRTL